MRVSFEDYMKQRTPTSQTGFIDHLGHYGSHTNPFVGRTTKVSKKAHRELIDITKNATTQTEYIESVRYWTGSRLPFRLFDLPF